MVLVGYVQSLSLSRTYAYPHEFDRHRPLMSGRLAKNFEYRPITTSYKQPTQTSTSKGETRRAGFELEFTGLSLEQTEELVCQTIDGVVVNKTSAEAEIESDHGPFTVEVDWDFLKRRARADKNDNEHLDMLADVATLLVPIEVVCPPIAIDNLDILDRLVEGLRAAGAKGTDNSPIAAYGVHINAEIPNLSAELIDRYLKSFAVLQWWLVSAHEVNLSRRMTPYIDVYPAAYLIEVVSASEPTVEKLIDSYLAHNPTRNRALDMLPLFAELDADRVKNVIDDPRIKSRPAFHYRLPNCRIDKEDWSLAEDWNLWWVVEELANQPEKLQALCQQFLESERVMFGIDQKLWSDTVSQWLTDQELV